jgi:natural product biosynthesis luciferase-like monooxygenase protein
MDERLLPPMQFGIFSLPTYFPEIDGTITDFYQHILQLLEDSERLGFDTAWVNEHHFHTYGGMIPAPPVLLAALAARTTRIRLGTSVALLPLQHPLATAEAYAMLDQVSGGRLEFGIGRGFMRYDYQTLGVPWAEGQDRAVECIEIIRKAWQERPFSHRGGHYAFDQVSVWPPPLQTPHPPIWLAATSTPESFSWAGREGFQLLTVIYLLTVDELAALIERYREAAAAAGRPPESLRISTHLQVYCREDGDAARREGEQAIRRYLDQINEARMQGGVPPLPIGELSIDRLVAEGRVAMGTPDECADVVERARQALGLTGVDCTFYFGGIDYPKARASLELFAREVMPRFQRAPRLATRDNGAAPTAPAGQRALGAERGG